jgi:hypothetical protein
MIELHKEAEEYANYVRKDVVFDDIEECLIYTQNAKEDFIAGANSKYVQAKILQAQIDVLKELDIPFSGYITTQVYSRIEAFRKQLKELENG